MREIGSALNKSSVSARTCIEAVVGIFRNWIRVVWRRSASRYIASRGIHISIGGRGWKPETSRNSRTRWNLRRYRGSKERKETINVITCEVVPAINLPSGSSSWKTSAFSVYLVDRSVNLRSDLAKHDTHTRKFFLAENVIRYSQQRESYFPLLIEINWYFDIAANVS